MAAFISAGPLFAKTASVQKSASCVTMMAEKVAMSRSVPFLLKPSNLEGLAGGYDFDPLMISNYLSARYLAESEIKHGRVAMLACLGFWIQEFFHLPGEVFSNNMGTKAFSQVPTGGLIQIFLFCGLMEFITHKGKLDYKDISSSKDTPGAFGFDPLNLDKGLTKFRENEVQNGRLAMLGIAGLIHGEWMTGHPAIYSLTHFHALQ
mmetsp:Transcript_9170/g.16011  ORF Transcript_9170/g.16011 Transcript_9170/m.16011 type:complete len:206 (+) Transcript_9170:372-989(+)